MSNFEAQRKPTEKQWNEVVAEVSRLAQIREDEHSQREITAQVLQELNLPTDLLDEALQQVQYREALAKQQRQRLWMGGAAVVLLFAVVFGMWFWSSRQAAALARITADTGRITLAADQGQSLSSVTANGQEYFYRATLRDVPLGKKLQLSCDWLNPAGQVVHQSNWETRVTDKAVWETQCRCQLGQNAAKGDWKVAMKLGDRVVSSANFKVE